MHSCRADPIKRSTRPFCQGERKDVGRSRIPMTRTRALNTAPNARSLSRMRYFGAVSHGNASVIWRANHSAVGLRVTANDNNCRRLWPRTRNAKSCERESREAEGRRAVGQGFLGEDENLGSLDRG